MSSASSSGAEPVRLRLARLAREASLAADGVVCAAPGPLGLRATVVGRERVAGVVALAEADGRYGVTLHLTARLVPLPPLAEQVRARVREAASAAGLADSLGSVDVAIDDVEEGAACFS